MIKAIIFDCFGVLYPDTYWTMAVNHLGTGYGGKKDELSGLVNQVDMGFITRDELWITFGEIVGLTRDEVYAELKDFGGLDKRLLKFIEAKKNEKFRVGMISNVGKGFIDSMFTDKPATYYFDSIILSSNVGLVKPDRRIYELSAGDLGLETNECVFTDDLEKNVVGAQKAGMQAIQYKDYDSFVIELEQLLEMSDTNK